MFKNTLRFLVSPCPISLWWLPWMLCIAGLMIDAVIRFPGAIHGMVGISIKESLSGNYTDWHPSIFAFTFYVMRVLFYEPFGISGTGQG
ncbi:MAG: hypothetical protein LBN39_11040, partial [Planctomycetaceae bacterium]|nr:hypothetical protein [Planctomycetaceae bacterium]